MFVSLTFSRFGCSVIFFPGAVICYLSDEIYSHMTLPDRQSVVKDFCTHAAVMQLSPA